MEELRAEDLKDWSEVLRVEVLRSSDEVLVTYESTYLY